MDCKIFNKNDVSYAMEHSLSGLSCANQELAVFDFGNVLFLKDYLKVDFVKIISGGSNFLGEYVGKGMLTATVQGNK